MNIKRLLTVFIVTISGTLVLLSGAGIEPITQVALTLIRWVAVLTTLALLFGLIAVAGSHLRRIIARNPDWGYSVLLLVGMGTVIVVGLFGGGNPLQQQVLAEGPVRLIFTTLYEPLASSFLALLAFFSLSAALRALGEGRREAQVIVAVAVVMLLVQFAPVANLPVVGDAFQVFNDSVVVAGARGLLLGVTIGTLVASLRVLLGFDLPFFEQ